MARDTAILPVVIFGARLRSDGTATRTLRMRVAAAHAFGMGQGRVMYMPTGGPSFPSGLTEASVMERQLAGAGVPPDAILAEETAHDTLASVLACSRLLRQRGHVGPVAVATSAYHLPRCLLLMRIMGWRVLPVPPPRLPAAQDWRRRWFWRVREVAALQWDALLLAVHLLRRGKG